MSQAPCPLCERTAEREMENGRAAYFYECRLCGRFVLTRTFEVLVPHLGSEERSLLPYLSAHTGQATEALQIVTLTTSNWKDFAAAHKNTTVSQKLTRLLQYLVRASRFAGDNVKLDFAQAAPLFDAVSDGEVNYLVDSLGSRYDIVAVDLFAGGKTLRVTPEGWGRVSNLRARAEHRGAVSLRCRSILR